MNDTYGGEPFSVRADFVESHPEWQLHDDRAGDGYNVGFPLDSRSTRCRTTFFGLCGRS